MGVSREQRVAERNEAKPPPSTITITITITTPNNNNNNNNSTKTPSPPALHPRLSPPRYHLINALANQLRFPNSHTRYFACILLLIFHTNTELVKEQITRVLLERLIAHRPHPWGLLVTFIELVKNPIFRFWDHEFTRQQEDIKKLFESVAKTCLQGVPREEQKRK